MGYPRHDRGYPLPRQQSECCYGAGSKPLAVMQEDFLVSQVLSARGGGGGVGVWYGISCPGPARKRVGESVIRPVP